MTEKNSSTTKLDSLYEALEIPQKGEIPCVGHLLIGDECPADQKDQRENIESILHDIIYTIENGYTAGSDEVKDLLEDLAKQLVCTDMVHDHLSFYRRTAYGKHEWVALDLGKRLRGWGEKLGEKDSDEDDEKVTVSAKNSNVLRPKLTRETPMINESACVTPTKQRGRPSCNSRPSTPRTGQGVDAFDSLSVLGDALPSSPESFISPGVSEVFSPVSTASTPMSIPDSEIRLSRYRYSRGEEESPTRGRRSSKGNDLLDGVESSRRATNKGSASTLSRTSKYNNNSTPTKKKSYRNENEQLDQGSQLSDQDSDNQRQIDDEEELEEQSEIKDKNALFPLKVGNMVFDLPREDRYPLKMLRERLQKSLDEKSLSSGWVYCFAERTAPGYLKIGYTQCDDNNSNARLSLEEQNDAAQVMKRLRMWERECKHNIDYKFIFYMPYAVQTMEGLIHRTLHKRNRTADCPNPDCKTVHREWFEISEMEARRAVEVWQQYSELKPYTKKGQLKSSWHDRSRDDTELYSHLPVEEWVYERWVKVIVPAVIEREKRISELQRKQTRLAERREEVEERKNELELEINDLKTEEKRIQQELAELQGQH
ncbi:hypothetical protein CEP51_002182 [Fusarium floridanum]|uniref:Bacteriophage T5 Orf172 DNA-binding domain-containing protein n=1 Tax=Fusarium floridanum TaxID=1325733 RepID=A0A428SCL2_9HYPO|nr:hypothetical protein CEP51_002182 [Fusarium floridanum]